MSVGGAPNREPMPPPDRVAAKAPSSSTRRAAGFYRIKTLPAFRLFHRTPRLRFLMRVTIFLFLLGVAACNRTKPRPAHQAARHADHRALAARFKRVVKAAGGRGVWIKPSAKLRAGTGSVLSLEVLATPRAYGAVLAAVRVESNKDHLSLASSIATGEHGLHTASLNLADGERRVLQIHLREVPRLLRAAIVIDDMGNDLGAARKLLAMDDPLTLSVLPHLRYSRPTAEEAHLQGHEVILHLPMEPEPGAHVSPGEGAVLVGMSSAEVQHVVDDDLASIPYAAGVNNHMGSRATQDAALMGEVMKTLAGHRLYFIDSRTTRTSLALEAARHEHLPAFYRSVFLDDTETVPYTLGQLNQFRHRVEREGTALAIGHPHPTTITALQEFLPALERADIELVSPSQIVRVSQ